VAYDAYYEAIGGKGVTREWDGQVSLDEKIAWEFVGNAVSLADQLSRCRSMKEPNGNR
jgi:hypothetical protein